jgi:hypothetical protein
MISFIIETFDWDTEENQEKRGGGGLNWGLSEHEAGMLTARQRYWAQVDLLSVKIRDERA